MGQVQAKDVVLQLSEDGVTYKPVVCEIDHTYNREKSVNTVETKCYGGTTYVSLGAKSGTIEFTGAFETLPGTGNVSANDINSYFENDTYLYFKIEYPSGGASMYRQGRGYITSLSEPSAIGDLQQFTFTLTQDGVIDLSA